MEHQSGGEGSAYSSEAGPQEATRAASQAREAINLRVLLELRRRMKSAAEKELAVGADRSRALRSELRRSEAELRLCARMMKVRAAQLGQAAERSGLTQGRASQSCARLAALARENDDLARQLSDAQDAAGRLELSVRSEQHAARGVLEAFVLATNSLMNELSLAAQDQASIQVRMRDLMEETQALSARAGELRTCYQAVHTAMTDLHEAIDDALAGAEGRPHRPVSARGFGTAVKKAAAAEPAS